VRKNANCAIIATMVSEDHLQRDDTIDIDRIERCRTFDELKRNDSFRQFMRILYKEHPELFSAEMNDPLAEELVDYFARHPSIWNEAEEFWRKNVRKESKNLDSSQVAMSISNHIRGLIAGALQQGALEIESGEDRGDIFDFNSDFNSRKNRPNRKSQPEFSDPKDAVGTSDAEMGFDLSPAIQAARIPRDDDKGYTAVPEELYEATKMWLTKAHSGWEVQSKDIIYMRDALTAYQEALRAMVGPEGNAVMCTPIYGGLLGHAYKALEKAPKTIPLKNADGQLVIDTAALRETLEKGDVFILCNPQNPGGHVYRSAELLEIKEICQEKKVKIISDEAHDGLVFEDNFVSMGSLYDGGENPTATLVSTGKTFNLSDQPCHMMIIPDANMREAFDDNRIQTLTPTGIPNRAAKAAFTESDEWRIELLNYLRKNCDYVYDRISAMTGLSMTKPEGTYLAWIDARGAGLEQVIAETFEDESSDKKRGPADYFAKVVNVAVANGSSFDFSGASDMFFRLNFAVPRSELKEMLDRIEQALPAQ